ncbi:MULTISPECIES: hypothetical protein [Bradyrhizobium]|uniref:Uncharacterized protein n=1 Tax=Bradyrhizobium nanningense TaxID=1325118 RepID=A0A4Q0S8E0_9BRAD|nr:MULTISPECIES: hypothetical protein [Bradyrhizobium]RXH26055.1 hypothetical protein XH84_30710 [Bradyrhizobium nanningense]RXH33195.1 hypothetical protein XH99_09745 [Bradyrhizobium nanningense]TQF34550.1 hypothetical protein UNPA324_24730 [Bradyrhizobium sp. UNPA324]
MRHCLRIGFALAALCGASTLADARPPTVVTSPGYDRRLQESRSQLGGSPTTAAPVDAPAVKPKRTKKKHAN